jgi:hypothetical protein
MVSQLRPAAEAESDSQSLASLDATRVTLRGRLLRKVTTAAAAAGTEAQRMGVGPTNGEERDVAGLGEMPSGDVDVLVTRLTALRGARDLLVAQLRVEGALQEAQGIITSVGLSTVVTTANAAGGGGGGAVMLDKLEAGAAALRTAARAGVGTSLFCSQNTASNC